MDGRRRCLRTLRTSLFYCLLARRSPTLDTNWLRRNERLPLHSELPQHPRSRKNEWRRKREGFHYVSSGVIRELFEGRGERYSGRGGENLRTNHRQREGKGEGAGMEDGGKTAHAAEVVEGATGKFRVLFCGEYFPSSFRYTRDRLKPYPHILVETLPEEEIASRIHEYDMCVSRTAQLDSDTISRGKRLKVICQFGMGLDGVDIEAATQMGIKVGRIPGVGTGNALSCAEHAIYLILSLLRDQKAMERSLLEKRLGEPLVNSLFKKTVFIVGYGNIGKELAPRLKPFGVRILAIRPSWSNKYQTEASGNVNGSSTTTGDADYLVDQKGGMEHLHEFNSQADIVVMCCPLTPTSKGMVNEKFLASMKRGALLVNVARGGLMDYNAVTAALKSGHLGGLGTDVTWVEPVDPNDPILQLPNVLVTPHVAGVTEHSYSTMSEVLATSAVQLCEGKTISGLEFVN